MGEAVLSSRIWALLVLPARGSFKNALYLVASVVLSSPKRYPQRSLLAPFTTTYIVVWSLLSVGAELWLSRPMLESLAAAPARTYVALPLGSMRANPLSVVFKGVGAVPCTRNPKKTLPLLSDVM